MLFSVVFMFVNLSYQRTLQRIKEAHFYKTKHLFDSFSAASICFPLQGYQPNIWVHQEQSINWYACFFIINIQKKKSLKKNLQATIKTAHLMHSVSTMHVVFTLLQLQLDSFNIHKKTN